MAELTIVDKFINFLVREKGYPLESILKELRLNGPNRSYQVDIAVVSEANDVLALFELGQSLTSIKISHHVARYQDIKRYLAKEDPRAFLVVWGSGDEEFQILELSENNLFVKLPIKQFPTYAELLKTSALETNLSRIIGKKEIANETIVRKRASFYVAIVSFVLSGVSALLIYAVQVGTNKKSDDLESLLFPGKLDSAYAEISSTSKKLANLNAVIDSIKSKQDTILNGSKSSQVILTQGKFFELSKKVEGIEKKFALDPKNILDVRALHESIERLRVEYTYENRILQNQIENLKERENYLIGLVGALVLSIIGLSMSVIIQGKQIRKE